MRNLKEDLIKIVGRENVCFDEETLETYREGYNLYHGIKPLFEVCPRNVEQVRDLVHWANETATPLVPVSSGGNHYKNDTSPSVPLSVIVNLSKMNRIVSINRKERMVVVEPGVNYAELLDALALEGLTLSTSLAPKAKKSVLASVLEVEPRICPNHQWSYTDPLRCVEVTWGDGNTMFTGEAGGGVLDLKSQWDAGKWQVNGNGPNAFDFTRVLTSAQGTMGIVTWASLRCEVLPKIHKMFAAPSDELEKLIDFVYQLLKFRFSDELLIVNKAYLAYLTGESSEDIYMKKHDFPNWSTLIGIVGRELLPNQRVEAQQHSIEAIAQQSEVKIVDSLSTLSGEQLLDKITRPSNPSYWKETFKGGFEDIFFITTLDRTPLFIDVMYTLARKVGFEASEIGVYIQPQHCGTSVHLEFTLPYSPNDPKSRETAKKLYMAGSNKMAEMGAYYARPYNVWSHLQLNKDAQSYATIKKLKEIFDPNNIMNKGKLTI